MPQITNGPHTMNKNNTQPGCLSCHLLGEDLTDDSVVHLGNLAVPGCPGSRQRLTML